MATKKSQKTAKVAPKATKTVKTTTGKTKTVPAKKPATKPAPKKTVSKPASTSTTKVAPKKKCGIGCIIACIIGTVAAIALIVIAIVAIVNSINDKNGSSLVVKADNGEKITTEYREFNDGAFKIKVPVDFKTMTSEEIKNEYKEDVDLAHATVYTSEDKAALMMIDYGDTALSNDQIKTQLDSMKSLLDMTGENAKTNYYQLDDHNIAILEFTNEVDGVKRNVALLFFSQNDKIVTIQFSYKTENADRWSKVSDFVLKSLNILK